MLALPLALTAALFPQNADAFRAVGRLDRTVPLGAQVRWIVVENHAGSVRVRQGGAGRAEIRALVEASGSIAGKLGGASFEREVALKGEGGGLRIRNAHIDAGDAGLWRIHWDLVLPADLLCSIENGAGDLDVGGGLLKGSPALRTGTGSIAVAAEGLEGSLRAASGSGDIRIELKQAFAKEVDLQVGGGTIRVTLPKAFEGRIDLETASGQIQAKGVGDLCSQPRGGNGAQLAGVLGGGVGTVRARTGRGAILFSRID